MNEAQQEEEVADQEEGSSPTEALSGHRLSPAIPTEITARNDDNQSEVSSVTNMMPAQSVYAGIQQALAEADVSEVISESAEQVVSNTKAKQAFLVDIAAKVEAGVQSN